MAETTEVMVSNDETACTVRATGELDLRMAREFESALMNAAMTGKPVIVDLLSAIYIDTAILASLARLATTLLHKDERLKVLVTSGSHPEYVLKTVGFDSIMDIERLPETSAVQGTS
jgi:anti-anti-sigma factor